MKLGGLLKEKKSVFLDIRMGEDIASRIELPESENKN